MSVPVWVLLAFTAWTLLVLAWYRRALRAHANCVENLPELAALVLVITVAGIESAAVDVLALLVMAARIPHTLVHVCFEQTNKVVFARSMLFITQWICFVAIAAIVCVRLIA